jgi:hypothetical protein
MPVFPASNLNPITPNHKFDSGMNSCSNTGYREILGSVY